MAKTVHWRGIDVDPITADMLTAIAKAAGDDIYVQGISGYGSYRSNAASGGTDSGGGHADLNMVGYSDEQCRRLETTARSLGACAYWRPERRPDGTRYGWQNHVHILRIDCADLSPAAKTQVSDYLAGYDGLYYGVDSKGNRIRKKDTGSRSHTGRRWLTFSASLGGPNLVPSKPIPASKPVPEEDIMASLADLDKSINGKIPSIAGGVLGADIIPAPKANLKADPKNTHWTLSSYTYYTYASLQDARAELAAMAAAVKALAGAQGLDPVKVEGIIKASVTEALANLRITSDGPDA